MILKISAAAQQRIERLLDEKEEQMAVRIFIKTGGCSGFKYEFTFDDNISALDQLVQVNGIKFVVDAHSAQYLDGAEVDWVQGLTGSFLKVNSPAGRATCGCGASFSLD